MASYLPTTDGGLRDWAINFSMHITTDASLGVTPEQAGEYGTLSSAYSAAYAAATNPETRGEATVLAKNVAKKALVAETRKLAMLVTNNPEVTDQQRFDCGLTVRDREPTPVPPPDVWPDIDIVSVVGRTVKIRMHSATSSGRGKPAGVRGASVFSFVGDAPPTVISAWKFEGSTTRTTTTVEFNSSVSPGSKVWLTAFWFNPRAQSGPACTPVYAYLNHEGLSQAA